MKQLKKTLLTLVALLAVTTGAWAQTPELLVTIESNGKGTSSQTFDGKAILTFGGGQVMNDNDEWGWYNFLSAEEISLTVTGADGYTVTSCTFYTNSSSKTVEGEHPTVYVTGDPSQTYTATGKGGNSLGTFGVTKIEVYGYAASSGPEVDWDKDKKSGSFTMPGGNVTLEPEYYPQAALTAAPTAINDVPATTDGAIVSAGTVANIGETTDAQGTVMYYVSPSALDDAALLALAADKWTADVPTAESLTEGEAYVYYYVRGNDGDTDDKIFSDGDILAANKLTVTIGAAPTYAVTFADDLAEPDKWTASPAADVKKGQTVTVTYTGSKKVIGVKAEKKEAAPAETIVTLTPGEIGDLSIWGSNSKTINGITIAVSGDSYFNTAGLMQVSGYDPETGEPISATGTFTFTSSVGKIKRIDINHNSGRWWGSGAGWPGSYEAYDTSTFTWSGTPAASVTLSGSFSDEHDCSLYEVSSFVFTIEPTN